MLFEGVNGPNTFNTESAAYGFIDKHFRLVIPSDLKQTIKSHLNTKTSIGFTFLKMLNVAYWNFLRMVNHQVDQKNALFIALYRARLVKLGYLYVEKKDRAVALDEVDFSDATPDYFTREFDLSLLEQKDANGNVTREAQPGFEFTASWLAARTDAEQVQAYLRHGANREFKIFLSSLMVPENMEMAKHITFCAEQYAAMTYLVFRQMGHHYKEEYDAKYSTLWRATTLEASKHYPGHAMMHRSAIHSFGVKALHDKFFYNLKNGKLAETFVDRADVAPAGAAKVATCAAAINLMRSLPVWSGLYTSYKGQIDALMAQMEELKNAEDAIKFHKNARLFGKQRYQIDDTNANALAAVAKGFIDSLGSEADMSKQRTLNKVAAQNPAMSALVAGVINSVTRKIARAGDLNAITAVPIAAVPARNRLVGGNVGTVTRRRVRTSPRTRVTILPDESSAAAPRGETITEEGVEEGEEEQAAGGEESEYESDESV